MLNIRKIEDVMLNDGLKKSMLCSATGIFYVDNVTGHKEL